MIILPHPQTLVETGRNYKQSHFEAAAFMLAVATFGSVAHLVVVVVANPILDHPALQKERWLLASFLVLVWLLYAAGALVWRQRRMRRRALCYSWIEAAPVYAAVAWVLVIVWNIAIDPTKTAFLLMLVPNWPWWPVAAAAVLTVTLPLGLGYVARRRWLPWEPLAHRWFYAVPLLLALLLLAIAVGPETRSRAAAFTAALPAQARVRLLGLDGADWRTIDAMIAEGQLPNFARLRREGATSPLQTLHAPSPVIWTTIASGYPPQLHGITGFFEYYISWTELRLPLPHVNPVLFLPPPIYQLREIGFHRWLVLPLWIPLDVAGRSSVVFRWLFSGPPPRLRYGVVRADNQTAEEFCIGPWPSSLSPAMAAIASYCSDPYAGIVPGNPKDSGAYLHDWPLFVELAKHVDFAAYYHGYIDGMSHAWHAIWQQRGGRNSDPEVELARAGVAAAYQAADQQLGQLFASATSHDVVIVVSDHGWDYDHRGHYFSPPGIFGIWRPEGLPAGILSEPVDVYQIAPLIAAISGVPLASDWPGLAAGARLAHKLYPNAQTAGTATYAITPQVEAPRFDAEANKRFVERLQALGYLQ